jgi:hypothetical protein
MLCWPDQKPVIYQLKEMSSELPMKLTTKWNIFGSLSVPSDCQLQQAYK